MSETKFNQQEYINSFKKEKYDAITVYVPKGYKEKFKNLVKSKNLSMAGYIVKLIDEAEG